MNEILEGVLDYFAPTHSVLSFSFICSYTLLAPSPFLSSSPMSGTAAGSPETSYKAAEPTPDIHNAASQIQMAKDGYTEQEVLPTRTELGVWYLYDLSSFFVPTLLLPVVFPLLLLHLLPSHSPATSTTCPHPQYHMYQTLVRRSISVGAGGLKLSPLNFSSISWAVGVVAAAPAMAWVGFQLDHGQAQHLIAAASVAAGGLVCFLTGLIKSPWPFLPYTAVVAAASTVAAAGHARHLGLLVRGFAGAAVSRSEFQARRAFSEWLSTCGTAAGYLGAAVIATFTYEMLRRSDRSTSLWVVSIFAGLVWLAGEYHALGLGRQGVSPEPGERAWRHAAELFSYPHAAFGLAGAVLASFATSCIFAGGLLYLVGVLCYKPVLILSIWLAYFATPLLSLPLLHLLNLLLRSDALRVQLISLLAAAATAGTGFFYRDRGWHAGHVLAAAAVQSAAAGALHSCGRVLVMDCAPPAREGAFAAWLAWGRAAGAWAGFAVAAADPASGRSFAVAFCGAMAGVVVMVVGKVSHLGGAAAAGHVREGRSERGSPARGLDSSEVCVKAEVLEEGRVQL